jgi:hypothetical protein
MAALKSEKQKALPLKSLIAAASAGDGLRSKIRGHFAGGALPHLRHFCARNPVKFTNPLIKLKKNIEIGNSGLVFADLKPTESIAQPGNLVVKRFEVIRICASI